MHEGLVHFPTFLTALLILIVAAKLGAEIAERLGQPSVLGEIFAGILVGATGFGLIVRGMHGVEPFYQVLGLTAQSGQATYEALDVLAEIGVIFLLFEIGLHSDLYELRRVGKSALWVGAAGVVLPFLGGWFVASQMFGLPSLPSIFIGAALTATSVGITARVFRDLNLLHTKESQIVLGAAVADDVIGLVILAVISAMNTGGGSTNLWLEGGKVTVIAVGFLIAAVVIGVKCVPLVQKVFDLTRSRGAITVLALAFCLLVALLAQQVRLAPIVGAFAAGLVLSHCNRKEEIQDGVKPLADIFIPLFFAMMGTVVSLRVLGGAAGGPNIIWLTAALMVVAVVGKVAGCMTVPDKTVDRLTIGLAMIPRGEVGLIFARLGIQNRYLSGPAYDAIVLMVLLTTLMTPPLLRMAVLRLKTARGEGQDAEAHLQEAIAHRAELDREDWESFEVGEMLQEADAAATKATPAENSSAAPLVAGRKEAVVEPLT